MSQGYKVSIVNIIFFNFFIIPVHLSLSLHSDVNRSFPA